MAHAAGERPWRAAARAAGSTYARIALIYIALYVLADRLSMIGTLPGTGFTLWNPPPALSLALLLTRGFRFAPVLFAAAVIADGVNGAYTLGLAPTLAMDAIIAAGYTATAAAIRRFANPLAGLHSVREVLVLLSIVAVGVISISVATCAVLLPMHALPPAEFLIAVRHFFIGDITGIIGLLPALMLAATARESWRQYSIYRRLADAGGFSIMLALALWIAFGIGADKEFQYFYLLLLPTIWISIRNGLPFAAMAILAEQIALVAVVVRHNYSLEDLGDFQLLSMAVAVTGLILGAAVTELRLSERRLRQHQAELGRMERITTAGALGSAIVHEISQPLATATTYTHSCRLMLKTDPTDTAQLGETLARVEAEMLRAANIVERLRDFLSKGSIHRGELSLPSVARAVVASLADEARRHDVSVSMDIRCAGLISADRLLIEQVLLNVIRNAIEAAAAAARDMKQVSIRLEQRRSGVAVSVQDTGGGVSPTVIEALFEPFATGKRNGLGLGLMLSRQIVAFHGGTLVCERTGQHGAQFVVWLPEANSAAAA